jgi:hypothetical protein
VKAAEHRMRLRIRKGAVEFEIPVWTCVKIADSGRDRHALTGILMMEDINKYANGSEL